VRERFVGDSHRCAAIVVATALVCVVMLPHRVDAQTTTTAVVTPTTTVPGGSSTTLVGTSTLPPSSVVVSTTVAPAPTEAPTSQPADTEPETTVATTARRITTTTAARPTSTRFSTTTSSSTTTSTTVVAAIAPSTSRNATITTSTGPAKPGGDATRNRINSIIRILLGVAGAGALLGVVYAWHTSPRRRVRLAHASAQRASQRLDDAIAASFVGTTLTFDAANASEAPESEAAAPSRDGLAALFFPSADEHDEERPNPRPDPRPRPNDAPWDE